MSDLESAIRNAAKSGRLNHVSLAVTWDGKWEAAYRGSTTGDHRIVGHSDPISALIGALTGRTPPEVVKKPSRQRQVAVVNETNDDYEDLL